MASGIDDLRKLNEQLAELLKDPQPGLATWRMRLSDLIWDIGQYGGRNIILGEQRVVHGMFGPR